MSWSVKMLTYETRKKIKIASLVAFCFSIFCFSLVRIFFGVDFTDEALYSTLAKYAFQGSTPYHDEMLVAQNVSIISVPMYWLHFHFFSNFLGIVLFFRIVYFSFLFLCSLFFIYLYKKTIPVTFAVLSSLLIITFSPFNIPSISYNTLTALSIMIGLMLWADTLLQNSIYIFQKILIGGLFLLLASFFYPPISIAVLFTFILFYGLSFKNLKARSGLIVFFIASAVISLSVLFFVIKFIGLEQLSTIMAYIKSFELHSFGLEKLWIILGQFFKNRWILPCMALLFAGLPLIRLRFSLPLAACILYKLLNYGIDLAHHDVILGLAISAAILLFILHKKGQSSKSLAFLIMSSLLVGFIFAFTSSNGLINSSLGLLAAAVLAPYMSYKISKFRGYSYAVLVGLVIVQTKYLYNNAYGDERLSKLNEATVTEGPYAGLRTSLYRVNFTLNMQNDLKELEGKGRTIAFFDAFTGAYLMSSLKIFTPTVWTYPPKEIPSDRNILVRYYSLKNELPDFVVWIKKAPQVVKMLEHKLDENDPLLVFFMKSGMVPLKSNEYYTIYQKPNG